MKVTNIRTGFAASLLAIVVAVVVARGTAAGQTAAAKGDQWETTSQMSMEGMPMQMPATTLKICAAKNPTEPPGLTNAQRNCKNSNFKKEGNKVTWDTQCTGPAMTGTGEIVYADNNSYSGTLKFNSAQGNMMIKLTGRKLGDCDNPQ